LVWALKSGEFEPFLGAIEKPAAPYVVLLIEKNSEDVAVASHISRKTSAILNFLQVDETRSACAPFFKVSHRLRRPTGDEKTFPGIPLFHSHQL
jgi:hypothetical protein